MPAFMNYILGSCFVLFNHYSFYNFVNVFTLLVDLTSRLTVITLIDLTIDSTDKNSLFSLDKEKKHQKLSIILGREKINHNGGEFIQMISKSTISIFFSEFEKHRSIFVSSTKLQDQIQIT